MELFVCKKCHHVWSSLVTTPHVCVSKGRYRKRKSDYTKTLNGFTVKVIYRKTSNGKND